ncbi:2',3'-cyclic-nucleotide 2'-phosphodiesterase (5'-nucleotidase family) [Bradyrhizobium sp. JR6.1]
MLYEGEPFQNDDAIVQLAARERQAIAPLAGQVLGKATGKVETNYTEESALADALTDILRTISSTDVALINTGGIRAPLEMGEVTYEKLFRVFPFNNHGVVIGPMRASVLLEHVVFCRNRDSQKGQFLIQTPCWNGGQHG